MKCSTCKKLIKEIDTPWERLKYWALYRIFGEEVTDIRQGMYTQGFSEGWQAGLKARTTLPVDK